jgi:arsenate reductase
MEKRKVLFVCVHNTARSQMAEAFLKKYGGDNFDAENAGLEPGKLNPFVVDAMKEIGVDISTNKTKSAFDLWKAGRLFSYVITMCDESSAEQCPLFPGTVKRLQWSYPVPASFTGSDAEKMVKVRELRDQIKQKILEFISENKDG